MSARALQHSPPYRYAKLKANYKPIIQYKNFISLSVILTFIFSFNSCLLLFVNSIFYFILLSVGRIIPTASLQLALAFTPAIIAFYIGTARSIITGLERSRIDFDGMLCNHIGYYRECRTGVICDVTLKY